MRSCIRREEDAALRIFRPDFLRRLGIHNPPASDYILI
jgi:hypothetical protein